MEIILAIIILLAIAAAIVHVISQDNHQMDDRADNYQAQNDRDKRMIERELKK